MNADELRATMVENALEVEGLSCADLEQRERFRAFLGPVSTFWDLSRPFRSNPQQGISTCGVTARALLGLINANIPVKRNGRLVDWIRAPYGGPDAPWGSVVSDLVASSRAAGCWITPESDLEPRPQEGDVVLIGTGPGEHVLTCVGWEGDVLASIDGGQVEPSRGLQCIRRCRRSWHLRSG